LLDRVVITGGAVNFAAVPHLILPFIALVPLLSIKPIRLCAAGAPSFSIPVGGYSAQILNRKLAKGGSYS
jgi:hypothetical protein